ncbi:hypothetical protein GGQ88_000730 [Novosphingobium hassiacum]|uniref:DUF1109 domain-containing protein n=1 Tax=Novosphingobium hassiacum TaxID=173676 RepID=A0A7W6EV20_9SPHN|nr:DUF1109 domain-containing protein [Novosphingobium hassiacum]MBB3859490.1 hypothetical protein [Novosphingobium hassiacum]
MQTEDLIRALAADVPPVSRFLVARRMTIGIVTGGIAALAGIALTIGFRPDLETAMRGFPFWMKFSYSLSLGLCAIMAARHLSRPESSRSEWLRLLIIPVGLLAAVSVAELALTPSQDWHALWLGESWKQCVPRVLLYSLPIFAGLLWAFRQFAPTQLRLTGTTAGLAAGACSATLYGFHCPEASATFVLSWYSLGIGLAGMVGALVGPRFMRW